MGCPPRLRLLAAGVFFVLLACRRCCFLCSVAQRRESVCVSLSLFLARFFAVGITPPSSMRAVFARTSNHDGLLGLRFTYGRCLHLALFASRDIGNDWLRAAPSTRGGRVFQKRERCRKKIGLAGNGGALPTSKGNCFLSRLIGSALLSPTHTSIY